MSQACGVKSLVAVVAGVLTLGACGGSEEPTGREYVQTVQSLMAAARCEGRWWDGDFLREGVEAVGCGTWIGATTPDLPIGEIEQGDWGFVYRWDDDPSGTGWSLLLQWASDVGCEQMNEYILSSDYGKTVSSRCNGDIYEVFGD